MAEDIQQLSSAIETGPVVTNSAAIEIVPSNRSSLTEILTAAANAARAGATQEAVQVDVSQWLHLIKRLQDVNNTEARALEKLLNLLVNTA